jgi:tetratricopeptide (TPR) repeat protein
VNRDAFDAYLRGRYSWNERTPAAIQAAIEHFRAAIQSDPAYAPAYAGLADCYNQLGTLIIGEGPPSETRPIAVAAARKALEIEDGLAEAHAALAYTDLYNWNWAPAEQGLRKAIELNPSYASAHLWYAHYLTAQRRFNEALQEVYAARDLDPLSPIIATQVGWMYHLMGRQEEAIAEYRKVLQSYPDYMWAHWQLGLAHTQQSRYDQAVASLERAGSLSGRNPAVLGCLAWAYGWAGERTKALDLLAELRELARRRYVSPVAFESVYIGLGDLERQFEYLEKEYQERSNNLAYFAVMPGRQRARADSRGQELMRRLGLAP